MDDVERHLRNYRPAGPPPELRERVLKTRSSSLWEWLPAAVAAALALTFSGLGANVQRQVAEQLSAAQSARTEAVNRLAASLGGDAAARQEAERLVWIEEQSPPPDVSPIGDPFR